MARDLLLRAVHGVAERHEWHKIPTMMDMRASSDTRFRHSVAKLSALGLSTGAQVVVFSHAFLKTFLTGVLIGVELEPTLTREIIVRCSELWLTVDVVEQEFEAASLADLAFLVHSPGGRRSHGCVPRGCLIWDEEKCT